MKRDLLRLAHELDVPVTVRTVSGGVLFWRSSDEDVQQAHDVSTRLQGVRHKRSRPRGGRRRTRAR
jgi:hypothetical protein